MTRPRRLDPASTEGPGIVVLNWTPASAGLLDQLARVMSGAGVVRITCIGDGAWSNPARADGIEIRMITITPDTGWDALVERLAHDVRIADAHSVIVLPPIGVDDPDSSSRLTCTAIRRACGSRPGPNVLVEVEDPEAAFEFVGLGVSTVFYSGHLRAALLGQACVDLGVFQFVVGLLRGRHRVRSIAIPATLADATFAEAALALESDEQGRAMTVIGITKPGKAGPEADHVVVNPGPRTPLREAVGLMVLISGDEGEAA